MEKKLNDFPSVSAASSCASKGRGRSTAACWIWASRPGRRSAWRKLAPLGDPVEVTLRGYELTLRKAEAASVVMRSEGVATQPALSEKEAKKQAEKAAKKAEKLAAKAAKGGKK